MEKEGRREVNVVGSRVIEVHILFCLATDIVVVS